MQLRWVAKNTWSFFDGFEDRAFVADGKVHRTKSSAIERNASSPNPQILRLSEGIHGREYESYTLLLSSDGQTLTCDDQKLRWNGQVRKLSTTYKRSSAGHDLQGSWQEAEPENTRDQLSVTPVIAPPPQSSWVIWTGPDDVMTWFIPSTGEVLRGKADGVLRPIGGPYFDGTTFQWKQTAPDRLEFVAYSDGKPEEYAVETISPDHETLTDVLWAPGHEDSKVVSVFHRHP